MVFLILGTLMNRVGYLISGNKNYSITIDGNSGSQLL